MGVMTPGETADRLERIATEMHQLEHPRDDRLALPAAAAMLRELDEGLATAAIIIVEKDAKVRELAAENERLREALQHAVLCATLGMVPVDDVVAWQALLSSAGPPQGTFAPAGLRPTGRSELSGPPDMVVPGS